MSNDMYQLIRGLRAVRSFSADPVSDADLTAILEAGRWTGSAKNLQLWAFIVITDPDQRDAFAACGSFMTPVLNAPVTIAVVEEPDGYEFDTGRVAQNMMLAAASLGIGSCPVTVHDDAAARPVLGLDAEQRCRYAIALGHPAASTDSRRRTGGPSAGRKPLDDIVHANTYGTPWR